MKLSVNQKGFTVIEGLLIFIIVAVIGGTGYYVYHSNKQADKNLKSASSSAKFNKSKITNFEECKKAKGSVVLQTDPEQCKTKGGKVFTAPISMTIKEWGVTFKLSATTGSTYYEQLVSDETNPPTYINVFSKKSDSIAGPTEKTCEGEYIAILTRMPKNDPRWDDKEFPDSSVATKVVGDYKYSIATHKQYQPQCFQMKDADSPQSDPATEAKFKQVADSFVKDFSTLQAN